MTISNNTFTNVATTAGTYVLRDFANATLAGSNNVLTTTGLACQAGPAAGSLGYTLNGGPAATCP